MQIGEAGLSGYILEEVLAYLIRNAGYTLIVEPGQDPDELAWRGNGLMVRGRGADHQVDVLGQLRWIPAFTFPIRLFVEAKFRRQALGIDHVRKAIGIILDLNQKNPLIRSSEDLAQKYQYMYALFSTSGFSRYATELALAHSIALNDIGGEEFRTLREAIVISARNIIEQLQAGTISDMSVRHIRNNLRRRLGTMPENIDTPDSGPPLPPAVLDRVVESAREYDELFVSMANGPYMLLLRAENPRAFLDYARSNPTHRVIITWTRQQNYGRTWTIAPSENRHAYSLSFRLPSPLSDWVFSVPARTARRAMRLKETYLSSLFIYRSSRDRDQLIRLQFDPEETLRHTREMRGGR